jgi:L-asparaginase
MDPEPIRIIATGGTFDKLYDEIRGQLVFQDTHVGDMLRLGKCHLPVAIETLMMIDSLDMTDADRTRILERCAAVPETRIVVTHGTDTMEHTAAVLGRGLTGKTVVLTGAMVPYHFGSSDGMFNLGTALAFAQTLPAGVYVAMNGRCFDWRSVHKNRDLGVFEAGPLSGDGSFSHIP